MNKTEKTLKTPSRWNWVQHELNSYIVQKNYQNIDPAEAFVKKRIGTLAGDIFRMYINSNRPKDLQKYLECHEAGHIIFGHVTNETTKDKINKFKIQAAWPKVKDRFNNEKQWERQFDSILYNVVEDMEVNSKMFTPEEWEPFSETIGGGVWPEDYGFPCGLDYNTYLNLVLKDPLKFLDDLENNMGNNSQDGDTQEGEGEGQGSSSLETKDNDKKGKGKSSDEGEETDEESDENGSGSGKKVEEINESDFEDAIGNGEGDKEDNEKEGKSQSSGKKVRSGNKLSEETLERLQEYFDKNDETATDEIMKTIDPTYDSSNGSSPVGSEATKINLSEKTTFETMTKDLEKLLVKQTTRSTRDMLYNYNRNKHNSNIIIPRVSSRENSVKACLYVLLDISGSISSYAISNFCTAFQKTAKKLNRKSRIILWNTQLVKDYSMTDKIEAYGNGGTDMASGMNYIRRKYNPSSKDVFFLVSDFQDNLQQWDISLKQLKCKKFAFIFSEAFSSEYCNEEYEQIENYINENDFPEVRSLWQNTKPIDIIKN